MLDIKKHFILYKSSQIEGWLMKGEPEVLYNLGKKYIKKGSLVAEVGSWKGKSTYILASICKEVGARLLSIDTFEGSLNPEDPANKAGGAYFDAYKNGERFFHEHIEKNLAGLPVEYMKMTSHQASKKIKNASLDFCFLDGDHTLPVIYQDIKDYLPKIKKGGLFVGHDYSLVHNPKNQVKESVDKIIGAKKIILHHSLWTYVPTA